MNAAGANAHEIDVLIIGAGHNGLVAGGYLARAGLEVQVLERRSVVGGACVTEELFPGFHFSSCSFMLYALHPRVAEDLELRRYGFRVFQLDPFVFRPYPDGRYLVLHQDPERNAEAIRACSRRDAESYRRWNRFWERFQSIVHPYVLTPPPAYADLVRRARETGNLEILRRVLITSHADLVEEFFESEHVRAAMIHSGDHGDPRSIGSALPAAFLPGDVEPERRIVGIVKGGMGAVTRAMAGYLESRGGAIRTGCQVRRVLVEDGRARGVELTGGETIRSRLVVSNADPKRTFLNLVEPEHLPPDFRRRVRGRRTEIGYFKFHAAMDELPDFSSWLGRDYDPRITTRVWICPSIDHVRRAWRDARRGRPSRQPVMSIQIPSIYDGSISPPGKHVLSIFAEYAPVRLARGNWDERREEAGEALIDAVTAYAPNFRRAISDWMLLTPLDLERRVSLTDGNIHHLDMTPGQVFSRRPLTGWAEYKTPIPGLWLCGAGTHPGGEVSGAPGHNAAHAVLRDLGGAAISNPVCPSVNNC